MREEICLASRWLDSSDRSQRPILRNGHIEAFFSFGKDDLVSVSLRTQKATYGPKAKPLKGILLR